MTKLHDSDGDGTYRGVADVPLGESLALIARGDSAGPEEKIHPQSLVQRDATITVDGAETVSTTVSFPEKPATTSPSGQQYTNDGGSGDPDSGTGSGEVQIDVLPDTGGPSGIALAAAGLALISAGAIAAGLRVARGR